MQTKTKAKLLAATMGLAALATSCQNAVMPEQQPQPIEDNDENIQIMMSVVGVQSNAADAIADRKVPDQFLRDPNFARDISKTVELADPNGKTFTVIATMPSVLFYLLGPGSTVGVRPDAADRLMYPFPGQKPDELEAADVVSVNGALLADLTLPRGMHMPGDKVYPFSSESTDNPIRGTVAKIEKNGHVITYYLDMNGDGKITLARDDMLWDMSAAQKSDKILEASDFWPTHKNIVDKLKVGSHVDICGTDYLLFDERGEFIDSRLVRVPEMGLIGYDGIENDQGAIYDLIWNKPTREIVRAAGQTKSQVAAAQNVAPVARSVQAASGADLSAVARQQKVAYGQMTPAMEKRLRDLTRPNSAVIPPTARSNDR